MLRPTAALALVFVLASAAQAQPAAEVPVDRVILFTSGVGYFEHAGRVTGDADVTLRFGQAALNDVLKSLVVEAAGGRVAGVVYPSQAPVERTLRSFAVDLSGAPDLADVLRQVRGAEVVVETPGGTVRGTVLSVGQQPREAGGAAVSVDVLSLVTPGGLVTVRLDTARRIAFVDPALQAELEGALAALAEASGGDRKPVRVQFRGAGARRVRLGYVIESPVWKTSYRLVLPAASGGASGSGSAALQGWALVENPTEADWADVDLTLVSGRPVSFVTDLYTPRYVDRPVVTLADDAPVQPETYAAGVGRGAGASVRAGGAPGTISGTVRDPDGQPLIGATVRVEGTRFGAAADGGGRFEIAGLPPGTYGLTASFVGFEPYSRSVTLSGGAGLVVDVRLAEGGALDEVTVSALSGRAAGRERAMLASDVAPAAAPAAAPPPIDPTASVVALGDQGDFGELFAYRLGQVTLPRRGSAMLPIVGADVRAERLSVYSGSAGRHPLRGVRLTNTTGASLRGGPMTVLDDGYAGDALLPDVPPGDDRLLTFAVDQDVLVDPFAVPDAPGVVETGLIRDGVLILQRQGRAVQAYRLENRGDRARTVLVEHVRQRGARLVEPTAAEETTPDRYRLRVALAPGAVDTLRVVEARVLDERVALATAAPDVLARFAAASGRLPDDVRDALRRAVADRRALAETEREIGQLQRELAEIEREQDRIRGNLNAVDNDSDYGRRLLAKLGEQESRIERVRERLDQLEAEAARQRQALRVSVGG